MHATLRLSACAALIALVAGSAMAAATVTFAQPERFADVPFSTADRERVLKEISAHFDKLAATLPAGQELRVEILDVDLAGEVRHDLRGIHELRILRGGTDWPHMHLRYAIEQDGKVLKAGTEHVSDMSYLTNNNRYFRSDFLRFEKKMLDRWFKETVAVR